MDAKLDALCDMVQGLAAATSASALQRQPQFHAADRPARPRPRSTATIDEPPARVAPLRDGMGVEGESWIRGWSPGTKAQEDSQSVTHIPSRFDVADVAGTALGPQGPCVSGLLCVYVCLCVCVFFYVHVCLCVCVSMCMCVYVYVCLCVCVFFHVCAHRSMSVFYVFYVCAHRSMSVLPCPHGYTCVLCTHVCKSVLRSRCLHVYVCFSLPAPHFYLSFLARSHASSLLSLPHLLSHPLCPWPPPSARLQGAHKEAGQGQQA